MIEYFIKVTLCSFLFLGFYFLLLQKEKMFRFNRIYLLFTLFLSLTTPLFLITLPKQELPVLKTESLAQEEKQIPISVEKESLARINAVNHHLVEIQKEENTLTVVENEVARQIEPVSNQTVSLTDEKIDYINFFGIVLKWSYLLIAFVFVLKFLVNFLSILWKASKSKRIEYNGISLIINERKEQLHSFWNYVFVPKQNLKDNFSRKELLEHEIAHIKQKHSIDILFIELVKSIFWFNPAFYLYKKSIQLNHEFLADEAVLKTETNLYEYQKLILDFIEVKQAVPIASNFNYILTKKRLLMMTKNTNSVKALVLQVVSIPFILVLIFTFSNKVYAQEEISNQLTKEQIEKLKIVLKAEDISNYLQDSVRNKGNYIDTLMIENKTYVISTSKEELKKIFEENDHNFSQKNTISSKEIEKIFGKVNTKQIEESFGIKELNQNDINSLLVTNTNKYQNQGEYYNSPEYQIKIKKQVEEASKQAEYYNSPEYQIKIKKQVEGASRQAEYYNSPEYQIKIKKQVEEASKQSEYYNSPEYQIKIKKQVEDAQKIIVAYASNEGNVQEQEKRIAVIVNKNEYRNDMDEFREEMRQFKKEMKEFKKELRQLK